MTNGGAGTPGRFRIRALQEGDVAFVLDMLSAAFGKSFDLDWFHWKHRSGPWGESRGWIALDEHGLLGARLLLPWKFRSGREVYHALRPCDTVTAPRARGLGVFRSLTERAIASVRHDTDFLFNTPNSQSRPGYFKMGFVEWEFVPQRVAVVWSQREALTDRPAVPEEPSLRTAVNDEFLRWRYTDCPTASYQLFGLEDEPAGLVCRLRSWHGMRLMVVGELWGDRRQSVRLLRGAAHETGAHLAWIAGPPLSGMPSVRRASTLVTRYDLGRRPVGAVAFSMGDVEDVL